LPSFRRPKKVSGVAVNTSILAEELAPLNAQIEKAQQKLAALEDELRVVEAELETFSSDRQRFDALRDVCLALDKLVKLQADELFWSEFPEVNDTGEHVERLRGLVAGFEGEISGILEKQVSLTEQINQRRGELDILSEEVREACDREERRQEEFVIEREVSSVPYRTMIMPWTKEAESEKRLRNAVLVALLICFVFGAPMALIKLPIPDREVTVVEIPKRLVKLVKKEPPRVAALPKPEPKQVKKEPRKPKEEPKPKPEQKKKADKKPKVVEPPPKQTKVADSGGGGKEAARKKAENVGVLAFKDALADLMKETPVAKVGTETLLRNDSQQVKGQAVAQRSLVALQAKGGTSGGIGNAKVSRNIGNGNADRLGGSGSGNGLGFVQAESTIAGLGESSRPLSDGLAAGRTDEEIQIVFDRYKATLYRIYNNELRKDPTLRGKMLMRISIEPNGEVSMCKVESTDLASPELVEKITARIKKFNFGPKEDVLRMTILYPIDFLPAG
jgi:outer membrane biosynthesis protein TonB